MAIFITIIQVIATFVPLWLIYLHFKWHSYWRVRGISGPTPWPIVGTTVYYMLRNKVDVDQDWAKKYGKVFGTYEGYYPSLMVSDSKLIDHIMVKNHANFVNRSSYGVHSDQMKSWLFFESGDKWINKRLLITPMFTSAKLSYYSKVMTGCIVDLLKHIKPMVLVETKVQGAKETPSKSWSLVNRDHFMSLALDIMCRVLHSFQMDCYKGKESEFHKRAFAFSKFDVLYWFWWVILPKKVCSYFQMDSAPASKFEYLDKLSQKLLDQRRVEISEGNSDAPKKPDIIQMMLDAKIPEKRTDVYSSEDNLGSHFNNNIDREALEQIHQEQLKNAKLEFGQFSDVERCGQMTFFFIAGFDTTSSSLSFCFHALAKHPAEQELIYEELVSSLTKDKENIANQGENNETLPETTTNVLTWEEVSKLDKLDQFISEALRLYPPVTLVNRTVSAIEGITLPSDPPLRLPYGSSININPFVVHRDPSNWTNPLEFDMSRFSKENKASIARGSYMPFGIGPRNCAGYRFATLNLKQVIANIVYRYRISTDMNTMNKYDIPPEQGLQYETHPFFLQLKEASFVLAPRV